MLEVDFDAPRERNADDDSSAIVDFIVNLAVHRGRGDLLNLGRRFGAAVASCECAIEFLTALDDAYFVSQIKSEPFHLAECLSETSLRSLVEAISQIEAAVHSGIAKPLESISLGLKNAHDLSDWTLVQEAALHATEVLGV